MLLLQPPLRRAPCAGGAPSTAMPACRICGGPSRTTRASSPAATNNAASLLALALALLPVLLLLLTLLPVLLLVLTLLPALARPLSPPRPSLPLLGAPLPPLRGSSARTATAALRSRPPGGGSTTWSSAPAAGGSPRPHGPGGNTWTTASGLPPPPFQLPAADGGGGIQKM
ncbi:hypothetical protein TSOC_001401 [Tetrabaena socialis]|uniref:Uncharacterized protein n=1 Tax=Tetrabaena socialis TaxID=47790 RepID=A0A2J8AGT8_9CHLO|nr:hypothetical protein TSOC_001401 [Tetrabaena socialis]|eukprot:PNH11733.1 hypothetical protein TSOC_001401 [Tetrabaena socialis]